MPPAEYQQGYEPPYGQQYQRDDGSMGQTYGPQVVDQAGTVSQPYFEYPKCKCCHVLISPADLSSIVDGRKKALLIRLPIHAFAC